MKVKSESEVAQLSPTLRDPMDCSLPGSSIRGIFQARVPEWGAIAFSPGKSRMQLRVAEPSSLATSGTIVRTEICLPIIQCVYVQDPFRIPWHMDMKKVL